MNGMMTIGMLLFAATCGPTIASPGHAWVAHTDNGRVLCRRLDSSGLSRPTVISEHGAAECPPAIALGRNGDPAVAWLDEKSNIVFRAFDGRRWSAPETVSAFRGPNRGVPSLGIYRDAVVAWPESDEGMDEDVFYAVRDDGRWSEPRRAHEENDVPDIMPSVAVSPGGGFCLSWKGFDGTRYIDRSIGDPAARTGSGAAPAAMTAQLLDARTPPHAALAWLDDRGCPRAALPSELFRAGERLTDIAPDEEEPRGGSSDASPTTIIAFGDSITYGRGSALNGPRTGYPAFLQGILRHNYPGRSFIVINAGVPGEVTAAGLNRLDEVLDRHPADYILIMEGTNDIYFRLSFKTIQRNLEAMAHRAMARGVRPLIATIMPTAPNRRPQQYRSTGDFYAKGYVQNICARYNIPCADQWDAFRAIPFFGTAAMDQGTGNHPNTAGYRYAMAPRWYATIAPLLDLRFEPTAPVIDVEANAKSLRRGAIEDFSYRLTPSNDLARNSVDCYAALRGPAGTLYFIDETGQLTPAVAPLHREVQLDEVPPSGHLLWIPIGPSYPAGMYTLYFAAVPCLRNPLVEGDRTGYTEVAFEVL